MRGISSAQLNYLKAKAIHDVVYNEYLKRTKELNFDEDFDKAFWESERIRKELNLSEVERKLTEAEEELINWLKKKVKNLYSKNKGEWSKCLNRFRFIQKT